jgi:single-strand DNA-binding protein
MKSLNRVTLMGHVVAKPEIRKTKSDKLVSSFAIATNNEWYDADGVKQQSVDFHRIVAWEGLAKLCESSLEKGSPVYIEGRLVHRSYEGNDQMKHFVTEVVLNKVNILRWSGERSHIESEELAAA